MIKYSLYHLDKYDQLCIQINKLVFLQVWCSLYTTAYLEQGANTRTVSPGPIRYLCRAVANIACMLLLPNLSKLHVEYLIAGKFGGENIWWQIYPFEHLTKKFDE